MDRIDDEFLLLSRGGRFSTGTHARLRRGSSEERARQELALREREARASLLERVRARLARRVRSRGSARGGVRRRVTHR